MNAEAVCPECASVAIMGHEVRGVYDGVLYWACMSCGVAWSRDWGGYGRRADVAAAYVAAHNARQGHADDCPIFTTKFGRSCDCEAKP